MAGFISKFRSNIAPAAAMGGVVAAITAWSTWRATRTSLERAGIPANEELVAQARRGVTAGAVLGFVAGTLGVTTLSGFYAA